MFAIVCTGETYGRTINHVPNSLRGFENFNGGDVSSVWIPIIYEHEMRETSHCKHGTGVVSGNHNILLLLWQIHHSFLELKQGCGYPLSNLTEVS